MNSNDLDGPMVSRFGVFTRALVVGMVVLVFTLASVPLAIAVHSGLVNTSFAPAAVTLAFWGVGVLVAGREPQNTIGWMLIASGAPPSGRSTPTIYADQHCQPWGGEAGQTVPYSSLQLRS